MKGLLKIKISARPPAIVALNSENETINVILEYYNKRDYEYLMQYCGGSINEIIQSLPTPIISDSRIYALFYGSLAYGKSGKTIQQKACLKILFSLTSSVNLLNDRAIDVLHRGITEYTKIAEIEDVDELNNIDVKSVGFKSSGCFIASAVFGTPYANEVVVLKEFRDDWLLKYGLGKAFVKFYYWISPSIANQIVKRNYLKLFTKITLIIPLLKIAKYLIRKGK